MVYKAIALLLLFGCSAHRNLDGGGLKGPGIHVHVAFRAILVAYEAVAATKQPQRSHLGSELNSVTSMFLWPLKNASVS